MTSKTVSGTTTDNYVNALDWMCAGHGSKTILLQNTGSTNSLTYNVITYAYAGGIAYTEIPDTQLTAGSIAQIILNNAYAEVVLQVKSTTAGASTTYRIDYISEMR